MAVDLGTKSKGSQHTSKPRVYVPVGSVRAMRFTSIDSGNRIVRWTEGYAAFVGIHVSAGLRLDAQVVPQGWWVVRQGPVRPGWCEWITMSHEAFLANYEPVES